MFTSLFRTWLPEPYLGLPKKMFKSLHPSLLAWRPHQALFLLLSLSPVLSQCEKSPGQGVHAWSGLETSQLSFLGLYVLHRENGSHITSPAYITGHFRIEQSKYRQENFLETFKWCEGLLWSLFMSDFAASVEPSSSSCLGNAKTTSQIPSKSHSVEWGKMQAPLSHAIKKKIKPLENHWCFWKCAVDCSRYYFLVCLGLYLLWTKKKKKKERQWKKSSPSIVSQGWVQLQDVRLREIKGDKNSCMGESVSLWPPHSWQVLGLWVIFCWQYHLLQLRRDFGRCPDRLGRKKELSGQLAKPSKAEGVLALTQGAGTQETETRVERVGIWGKRRFWDKMFLKHNCPKRVASEE